MNYKLLFVLPDSNNQSILATRTDNGYQLPAYAEPINDNQEIPVPQLHDTPYVYNDFFKNLTGVSVYRKYVINTETIVAYVCEQTDETNIAANGYTWISYNELLTTQQDCEIQQIINSVQTNYSNAKNFTPYIAWLRGICTQKNIKIAGEIAQIKGAWLFRVASNIGDLYMKICGEGYANEQAFTRKLIEANVPNLPEWVGYNTNLRVFLMQDMGGEDLSSLSSMDMTDLLNLFAALALTQKASIPYVNSADFCGYNYRIDAIINELQDFPNYVYGMLSDTRHKISMGEKEKLAQNARSVAELLKSVNNCIPDTIHNSDIGAYNVRHVNGKFIFYDWVWGGVSHPFFAMSRLLGSINKILPADVPAKEVIVNAYLCEWAEYGSYEELKDIFEKIDRLYVFHVMFFVKYIRRRHEYLQYAGKADAISAESRWLDKGYENLALYLRRFINSWPV